MNSGAHNGAVQRPAVLLINMGGPENPDEVKSFLANLFNDDHIIGMPVPLRFIFSRFMAAVRQSTAKKHYRHIGGGSPLKKWTRLQAEKLKASLTIDYSNCIVRTAFSYSSPFIPEAVQDILRNNPDKIIAVPLYPQYSVTTFGSIVDELKALQSKFNLKNRLVIIPPFYRHPLYTKAVAGELNDALKKINHEMPYRVVFTAHSLPQSVVDKGDPYRTQIEETISLVLNKLPIEDYRISFQSKIGPVKWMQPATIETVEEAGRDGVKQLVVMPVGFVCDHIETLYELDIELAEIARQAGIEKFVRGGVFNDGENFIELLDELVREYLK